MRWLFSIVLVLLPFAHPYASSQELSCYPCNHAFGKNKVGTTSSYSIRLSNTGTKSLKILSKSKQGSEFSYGSFPLPVTLLPGQSVRLPILFKPSALGHVTGSFTLSSTAQDPTLSIDVAGTGVTGAKLLMSPTSLNFGNVGVGKSATLPTTLTASGGNVIISRDLVTSTEFDLEGLSAPVTILSGHSLQVTVRFKPTQSGTASGKIGYFNNAWISPEVESLTGSGVAQSSHSVGLTWQDSGSGIIGYNVYRGTVHGGPYQEINNVLEASTNYTDYNVSSGKTYYYVTTAVDSVGHESKYSNETSAVIPTP